MQQFLIGCNFLCNFTFYLSILVLYPFFKNIRSRLVRQLSELNGNIGLNQNYKIINPRDKNYTYIPIVGTDDIHAYFFPKVNKIKLDNQTLTYKTGGLEYVAKYINILRRRDSGWVGSSARRSCWSRFTFASRHWTCVRRCSISTWPRSS